MRSGVRCGALRVGGRGCAVRGQLSGVGGQGEIWDGAGPSATSALLSINAPFDMVRPCSPQATQDCARGRLPSTALRFAQGRPEAK